MIITAIPFIVISPKGYLMTHGYKLLFINVIIIQVSMIYLVHSTGSFLENNYSYHDKTQAIITVVCILLAFESAGWLYANNKKNLFITTDNKVLLASFGDKYVWGTCRNESSEFYVTKADENIKLKKLTGRDVDELKICFRRAK